MNANAYKFTVQLRSREQVGDRVGQLVPVIAVSAMDAITTLRATYGSDLLSVVGPTESIDSALVSALLLAGGLGVSLPTKTLYVDNTRTDSYVENGSLQTPFKTIMGAVNQVITNADNSTYPYVIKVQPSTYVENVTLNNAALVNLLFDGGGRLAAGAASNNKPAPGTIIAPSSGSALDCSSNNDGLQALQFAGFQFNRPVNITDPTAANLGSKGAGFADCVFSASVTLSANSGEMPLSMVACAILQNANLSLNNVLLTWVNSDQSGGSTGVCTLTTSNGGTTVLDLAGWAFNPVSITVGSGCYLIAALGQIGWGSTAVGITVQSGGVFQVNDVEIACSVLIQAGGTMVNVGGLSLISGCTISNSGTYTSGSSFRTGTLVEDATLSPTSAGTAGVTGQIAWDASNIYVCTSGGAVGAATWKKAALSAA